MQTKKILCLIMAVLLIVPTIAQAGMINVRAEEIETEATAESLTEAFGEETVRTYEGNGYKITYAIAGSWENHQSIEITLENTGAENINDWSVTMDTTGTITGLWNATQQATNEEQTVIKCQTYNNTILPGSSITFGYTLEGENIKIPENIQLTRAAQEINAGYRVEYQTTGEWENGFQAEITIINDTTQPLEGWNLTLTGNFTIENYWNGEVTQNEDGSYTITHTAWDNSIPAGDIRIIGFVGTKAEDEMRIDSTKLTATTWGETTPSEPETDPTEPTNPTDPEIDPTEPDVPDEEINWNDETDSDEDGIPDVYENHMFQTNPESTDTDGDGLPDGYEIINLGTAPTIADTDENGIADGKEDTDNDGLDNLTEYELGTNPLSNDSDYDGLTDNDEIQTHKTDPNNHDTDGDGINDGDEIKLGLSPLNPVTNGVPDNQYTVSQNINETSPVLEEINASINNPYKLSLDIKAAGVAENSIYVQGTTENELFQNEAYIGELISIDYTDTLKVETLRLNFRMDEDVLENELDLFGEETTELKGIRRFNVFKFVEGANMLLPIETHHDTEQNIVYAETDEDGIYYLVDMEKWLYGLWTLNFEEQPVAYMMDRETESDSEEINVQNEASMKLPEDFYILTELSKMEEIPMLMSVSSVAEEKDDRPIDVVFVTQSEGLWNDGFYGSGDLFSCLEFRLLQRKYSNIRACVLNRTQYETYFLGEDGSKPQWFSTEAEMHMYKPDEYSAEETYIERDYLDLLCNQEVMGYREEAAKFVLDIQLGYNEVGYYYFLNNMENMKNMGINFTEFQDIDQCYGGYTATFRNAIESTGGIIFSFESSQSSGVYDFTNHVDKVMSTWAAPQKEFPAVVATGYRTIYLQSPLSSTNGTDSDGDTWTDWKEVNTDLLDWDGNGNIILPTLKWCIENASEESYVIEGLERFKEDKTPAGVPSNIYDEYMDGMLESVEILPIDSNPVRKDGDGDGIKDPVDEYDSKTMGERYEKLSPLKMDTIETLYPELRLSDDNPNNNEHNAVYFVIDENDIKMHTRVVFAGDYLQKFIENGVELEKTYKDVVIQGLTLWNGEYKGAYDLEEDVHYDFIEGMEVNFNVDVEEYVPIFGEKCRYIIINVDNADYTNDKWSEFCSKYFSYGIPHTEIWGWKPDRIGLGLTWAVGDITMYKAYTDRTDYDEKAYMHTIAHEFGHVLGLDDAYPSANGNIQLKANNEVVIENKFYNDCILMYWNGKAYPNDIEMILEAFVTEQFQSYIKYDTKSVSRVIKLIQSYEE